jgi:hypothetical protein
MEEITFTVLKDSPVVTEDWLGRRTSANHIAELISRSRGKSPFTMGIDGSWGTGKSSLMLMIEDELNLMKEDEQNKGRIKTVWFNAWMHQHKENLAEGLVKTILLELQNVTGWRPWGKLRLYWLFSRRILVTVLKILLHAAAGWAKVNNSVVEDIWKDFERDIELANAFKDKLQKVVSKFLKKGGLLVVFIDDLDRCGPDAIVRLFEAVKVYLEVEGLVFVLGYDRNALVGTLRNQVVGEHAHQAVNYLEKVVQIPYPVPVPTSEQVGACLDNYLQRSKTEQVLTKDLQPIIIEGSEKNPRRMKRFVNSFALAHSLGFFAGDLNFQARMWLLWMYFRSLHGLFVQNLEQTVLFKDYSEVRMALDTADVSSLDPSLRDKLSRFLSIATGDLTDYPPRDEVFKRLDAAVPAPFVELYRDESVRSLVASLADAYAQRGEPEREVLEEEVKAQAEALEREPQIFQSAAEPDRKPHPEKMIIAFAGHKQGPRLTEVLDGLRKDRFIDAAHIITGPFKAVIGEIKALAEQADGRGILILTSSYIRSTDGGVSRLSSELKYFFPGWDLVIFGSNSDDHAKTAVQHWGEGAVLPVRDYRNLSYMLESFSVFLGRSLEV